MSTLQRLVAGGLLAGAALAVAAADTGFDPAAEPASLAAAFLKTERLQNLASVKKVAIGQFRVEFAVENNAKAQSSSSAGWTSSRTDIKLVGVTAAAMQAIADRLHDRLVQDLSATGLEVIPLAALRDNEAYKSLAPAQKATLEPLGTQRGQSIFVGARGQPWYFSNDDRHLGLGTMMGSMSTTQPQNIEPAIARSLDAALLRVTLAVSFADQSTSGGVFRLGSSVNTAVRLALVPELSQILVVAPDGRARVMLDKPVLIDDNAAIELVDTTSDKTAQAVANVVTAIFAKGGRTSSQLEARTTPEAYSAAVSRYGLALGAAMVAALKPALPVRPAPVVAPTVAPAAAIAAPVAPVAPAASAPAS